MGNYFEFNGKRLEIGKFDFFFISKNFIYRFGFQNEVYLVVKNVVIIEDDTIYCF